MIAHDAFALPLSLVATCHAQIVDPAYSDWVHEHAVSTGVGGRGPRKRDLGFEPCTPELRELIALYASCLPGWTIVFSDHESTHLWRAAMLDAGLQYIRTVPWCRWSQPQITRDRPPSGSEAVLLFHPPGRKRWYGPGGLTHFEAKCMRGADKHPTEKPLRLMLDLVCFATKPGQIVLDPLCGSGTTGQATRLLGRGFVGAEKDARWRAFAERRLTTELSERDVKQVEAWVTHTQAEATAARDKESDGDERAAHRLCDVRTVQCNT